MGAEDDAFKGVVGAGYGELEMRAGTDMYQSQVALNQSQTSFNYWQKRNNRLMARAMARETFEQGFMWRALGSFFVSLTYLAILFGVLLTIHLAKIWVF